jgi:general secretion pathway protein K
MRRLQVQDSSGFVLVTVLWILTALATLALIYSSYAVTTAAEVHAPDDRLQAEASIRAAVEMTAFRKLAPTDSAGPSQGAFDLRVGRTRVAVRFRSEGARIDLNSAPEELLAGLFVAVGADPANAKDYASRVIGWRSKVARNTESPEEKLYARLRVGYPPRQAPFEDILELSLLPGLPPTVIEGVLPFVTVFSGRPTIDVGSADPKVLSALPGMTPAILTTVLKAQTKETGDGKDLLDLLGPARGSAATDGSKAVRAMIEVVFDNGRRVRAEVVLRLADTGPEPYDLLYWQDDFDGPTPS